MSPYTPTKTSLDEHALPSWFADAKLGIFVHWGPYSVPAWAPTGVTLPELAKQGFEKAFAGNPYAEWYWNTLAFPDGATRAHHDATWGRDFPYERFAALFRDATSDWSAEPWARLFARAGARYVVLTTKHHDGFLLWPSAHASPRLRDWHSERDLVGDLTRAVRAAGMRMGLYYSGGIDWPFEGRPVRDIAGLMKAIPQGTDYARYADAHWRELIERYAPSVLWNDIGYPKAAEPLRLMADYYARVPDGVVNNRFTTFGYERSEQHSDFTTPEYAVLAEAVPDKWEACRGVGNSFGWNRAETEADLLSVEKLVHLLVDVVSKNGNLLLNVGPTGDGTIPFAQAERLLGLGGWLDVNGEAIFGTRPWRRAATTTSDGQELRFTRKADAVYALLLGEPPRQRVRIPALEARPGTRIELLGRHGALAFTSEADGLELTLPGVGGGSPALALRIVPEPVLRETPAT
ncbi:MAG: alpha-L-fucosidase [Myxococcota bacterium]